MSLNLSPPSRCRAGMAAAVLILALTGCSSGDGTSEAGVTAARSDTKRVSAVGVSFEVPEGWEELDAKEVSEGAGEIPSVGELADQMGVTPEQFEQMMAGIDLFLFSDEGANQGFLDNINVLQIPGRMPNDEQVKLQFMGLGADVEDVSHEQTELGDATVVAYEVDLAGHGVRGQAVFVDVGDGPVSITVSATERDTTERVADGILDTLAEAS